MKLTMQCVQSQATLLGLTIVEDHNYTNTGEIADGGHGYWIEDPDTGDGPFTDGNFSSSLEEVAVKLTNHEAAKGTS